MAFDRFILLLDSLFMPCVLCFSALAYGNAGVKLAGLSGPNEDLTREVSVWG